MYVWTGDFNMFRLCAGLCIMSTLRANSQGTHKSKFHYVPSDAVDVSYMYLISFSAVCKLNKLTLPIVM